MKHLCIFLAYQNFDHIKLSFDSMYVDKENAGVNVGHTANNLVTLKKENLFLLKDIYYLDSNIKRKIEILNKKWVHTNKNIAYHLTWDLYRPGNDYYEFKVKNYRNIWHIKKESNYNKLV